MPSERRSASETLARCASLLTDATVDVLWRQWAAVGASASTPAAARALVDPEALVLASLAFGDVERRLRDVLGDWVATNADLLSVQRTRNLMGGYPESMKESIDWIAGVALREAKDSRWRSLVGSHSATSESTSLPRRRKNKVRARRVTFTTPATLWLKLRLGLGVGVKADVLAYLVCQDAEMGATVRALEERLGYTNGATRRALDDLSEAGMVRTTPERGAVYWLDGTAWMAVLEIRDHRPSWRGWHNRFRFANGIQQLASANPHDAHDAREFPSDYILTSRIRTQLEATMGMFAWPMRNAVVRSATPSGWLVLLEEITSSLANEFRAIV